MIRQLFQRHSLNRSHLLTATLTVISVVSVQSISLDHSLETLVKILLTLNSQTDRKKRLFRLWVMRTSLADYLVGEDPSKHVFDKSWVLGIFEPTLKSIKEHIRILINIHLLGHIGRISFIIFERLTEGLRIVVFLLTVFQIHEHFLHLIQDILLWRNIGRGRIVCISYRVAEVRSHEKLLIKTVHVTNTT